MKKIYSLLLMLLTAVIGLSAQTTESAIQLNIDDATHVSVTVAGKPTECTNGLNIFTIGQYETIMVKATEGNVILSVVDNNNVAKLGYGGIYSIYGYDSDGKTYTISTAVLSEIQTASFKLTINGDASELNAALLPLGTDVKLQDGEQTVKFSPEYEKYIEIESSDAPIYKVSVDGETVMSSDFSCEIMLREGMEVVVDQAFPDKNCVMTVTYGEGADGCVSEVYTEDGELDFNDNKFECKAGTEVSLVFDPSYKIDGITVNDVEQDIEYIYDEFTFIVSDDATIHIDAHPYGDLTFTIDINKPEGITIYDGYSYMGNVIELSEGLNTVKVAESEFPMISFELKDGYYLESVTDAEGDEYKDQQSIYVHEGMALKFEVAEYVMDQKAIVYIDDITAHQYFFYFMNASRTEVGDFKTGYNEFPFAKAYNPFYVSWGAIGTDYALYLNDEAVASAFENLANYTFELPDMSVVKVFLTKVPERCSVSFDAASDCKATVIRDLIVPVTDLAAGFECFAGTEVSVAAGDDAVKVNGEALTPDADGVCTFTVTADTKVSIGDTDGISDITVEAGAANDAVYNLQGVKVGTRGEMNSLPAGLYISNGKKVVVKGTAIDI